MVEPTYEELKARVAALETQKQTGSLQFKVGEKGGGTCLLCCSPDKLTDEHIFPAAIGGNDVVPRATCSNCNGQCSEQFEAQFNNSVKQVCYVLGIGNREGKIPSVDAVTAIDGTKFDVVLQPGGKFTLIEKKEQRTLDTGQKVTEYFLFLDSSKKTLEKRAAKRGERLEGIAGDGKLIEFEPESFMPLDFIGTQVGLRTATKVALMTVAKMAGVRFAQSSAFDATRAYILGGKRSSARLFVNHNFAANMHTGPHQHVAQVYCDGAKHTVHATVTFFGGLTYLVELSNNYDGADYGFTYGYDALQRKPAVALVDNFDTERLAIQDVLSGKTHFDDVVAMAEHWAGYVQSAAREHIQPVGRRLPI